MICFEAITANYKVWDALQRYIDINFNRDDEISARTSLAAKVFLLSDISATLAPNEVEWITNFICTAPLQDISNVIEPSIPFLRKR